MNISRLLTIFLLTAMIFTTPANPVHENKNHQKNFFTRSINATTSCLDRVLDVAIKYALLKPAKLWFEGQSKSEQERIVLESKEKSVAHESFKKLYGEKEYKDLLTEKTWEYKPIYTSDNPSAIFNNTAKSTQLKALGILFLFISPHFLPSVHSMNSLSANQEEVGETDNTLKMLPATFPKNNSICKTMAYLQQNIDPEATPYDEDCYVVASNRIGEFSTATFIGCNPIDNYFIRCFLVNPEKKVILGQDIVLTGKPSGAYQCEPEAEKIYKISDSENSTTIIEVLKAPLKIHDCSQFDLHSDFQHIIKNEKNFTEDSGSWILSNFSAGSLCLLNIVINTIQSFNQKKLNKFIIAKIGTPDHEYSAFYNGKEDVIKINQEDLHSLVATSGIISHELGHKLQAYEFLTDSNLYDMLKAQPAIRWHVEIDFLKEDWELSEDRSQKNRVSLDQNMLALEEIETKLRQSLLEESQWYHISYYFQKKSSKLLELKSKKSNLNSDREYLLYGQKNNLIRKQNLLKSIKNMLLEVCKTMDTDRKLLASLHNIEEALHNKNLSILESDTVQDLEELKSIELLFDKKYDLLIEMYESLRQNPKLDAFIQFQLHLPKSRFSKIFYDILSKNSEKMFNTETNADLLATLSFLLNNEYKGIMPLTLLRSYAQYGQNNSEPFRINTQFSLNEINDLKEHPDGPVRIAYTLEVGEKFETAQNELLNSYKSTIAKNLDS